uniref:Uncharacterized protein n=1 Tax=Triticum urartu TaxID=4572 RepID=A0A8R7UGN8_TRIUA
SAAFPSARSSSHPTPEHHQRSGKASIHGRLHLQRPWDWGRLRRRLRIRSRMGVRRCGMIHFFRRKLSVRFLHRSSFKGGARTWNRFSFKHIREN